RRHRCGVAARISGHPAAQLHGAALFLVRQRDSENGNAKNKAPLVGGDLYGNHRSGRYTAVNHCLEKERVRHDATMETTAAGLELGRLRRRRSIGSIEFSDAGKGEGGGTGSPR